MSASKYRPGDDPDESDTNNVVDADMRDPDEETLVEDGVFDIEEGEQNIADAIHLEKTEDILRKRGYLKLAQRVHEARREVSWAGHQSIQHGESKIERAEEHHRAHQVAALIVQQPTQLVVWQAAIKTITREIERSVPEEVFITAAGGDAEAGRQRRAETLHLGDWLLRLKTDAIQTSEQVWRFALALAEFVADIETIYERLPTSVKHTIGAALNTLLALFH